MSTRTSLGRTSMTVPFTISPAAKRIELCFMASSMVSIMIEYDLSAGGLISRMGGTSKTPLPNGPDVARQRRLRVRLYVNCFFSAYVEPPQTAFGQRIRYGIGGWMQVLFA